MQWTFTPSVKRTGEQLADVTVSAPDFIEGWEKADQILESQGVKLYEGDKRLIGYITKNCQEGK